MKNSQKKVWLLVGFIVVLCLVVYLAIFYKRKPKVSPANSTSAGTVVLPTANLTPLKGVLPPNFPVALLVGSSPTIVASGYTYDQKDNMDSWVVTATSPKSIASFAQAYDAYFKTNKWTIEKKSQTDTQLYYAAINLKSAENASITISTLPDSGNYIDINLNQTHAK